MRYINAPYAVAIQQRKQKLKTVFMDCNTYVNWLAGMRMKVGTATLACCYTTTIPRWKVKTPVLRQENKMDAVTKEYYQRVAMTHTQQIEQFGWCMCEDGEGHISDGCPIVS